MSVKLVSMVLFYLVANVAANLFVSRFGQAALVFTAFILIPFDLAARDILHDRWRGNALVPRMVTLIATASVITFAVNASALNIAIASTAAFVSAASIDTAVYHLLRDKSRLMRMNASNACSAVVDSIVFPMVAFGSLEAILSAAQSSLKFIGGFAWSIALVRFIKLR